MADSRIVNKPSELNSGDGLQEKNEFFKQACRKLDNQELLQRTDLTPRQKELLSALYGESTGNFVLFPRQQPKTKQQEPREQKEQQQPKQQEQQQNKSSVVVTRYSFRPQGS